MFFVTNDVPGSIRADNLMTADRIYQQKQQIWAIWGNESDPQERRRMLMRCESEEEAGAMMEMILSVVGIHQFIGGREIQSVLSPELIAKLITQGMNVESVEKLAKATAKAEFDAGAGVPTTPPQAEGDAPEQAAEQQAATQQLQKEFEEREQELGVEQETQAQMGIDEKAFEPDASPTPQNQLTIMDDPAKREIIEKVVELRQAQVTWKDICDQLKISNTTAKNYFNAYQERMGGE